jgi:hypothetical protein
VGQANLPRGVMTKTVRVRWNGRVVAEKAVTGETELTWRIRGDVGLSRLEVEAPIDPASDDALAWGAIGPVGVALGELRFTAP